MDKIAKAIQKLGEKERSLIKAILLRLNSNNTQGLDIKKLKGRDDIFRLRKRDLRVIYRVTSGRIFILAIERRREDTYKT